MSEDFVTIYRKSDCKPSKSEQQTIDQFIVDHDLTESSTDQQGEYIVYSLGFFNADISALKNLLINLKQQNDLTTVAKYYLEQTNVEIFFALINDELEEFEAFEDALNTVSNSEHGHNFADQSIDYDPKKSSLIKLHYKKGSQAQILKCLLELKGEAPSSLEKPWFGAVEPVFKFVDGMIDKGSYLVIHLNIHDHDLFPGFPSKKNLLKAMKKYQVTNNEIKEQQAKDLAKLGFSEDEMEDMFVTGPSDDESMRKELRGDRIMDTAETFLNNLLSIEGVIKGIFVLRSQLLDEGAEVYVEGIPSTGVFSSYNDKLSDLSSWLK